MVMVKGLRSAGSGLMHSYHNVAKLRRFRGAFCRDGCIRLRPSPLRGSRAALREGREALITAPVDLDVQVANLLPQRVAVQAEQIGRADLITSGRRQCRREQRYLNLLEDPVIKARRRHAVGKSGKMG